MPAIFFTFFLGRTSVITEYNSGKTTPRFLPAANLTTKLTAVSNIYIALIVKRQHMVRPKVRNELRCDKEKQPNPPGN